MFNFMSDSSAVSVNSTNGLDRNTSTPSWTAFIDSNNWVLVVSSN
jgi:hypothetical protein